jgi:hypothetical protein
MGLASPTTANCGEVFSPHSSLTGASFLRGFLQILNQSAIAKAILLIGRLGVSAGTAVEESPGGKLYFAGWSSAGVSETHIIKWFAL